VGRGRGFPVRAGLLAIVLLLALAAGAALSAGPGPPPKPPPSSGPPKPPASPPPPATQPPSPTPTPPPTNGGKPPGKPGSGGRVRSPRIPPGTGAVVYSSGCFDNTLAANDDDSSDQLSLPFTINFFGTSYSNVWVNNNGNVTFNGPLGTYTPFDLYTNGVPIIAPYFADVDTRGTDGQGAGSGLAHWGQITFQGHTAFCAIWGNSDGTGVGYYAQKVDKLNVFQVLLVQRSDLDSPGDTGHFDIVFNYDQVQWETGDASGGTGGLGGSSATVGYSNGQQAFSYELPGSHVPGSFLDSNSSGLVHQSKDSTVPGRYVIAGQTELAPVVTVVSAVPNTIGPSGTSTITWNATLDGTYSVLVGGSDCSSGNVVASGSYTASAGNTTTDIHGSSLSPGPNTIRVCVTNSNGTGSDSTTVTLQSSPPNVPTLSSPSDGSSINDSTPTLAWSDESVSGATSYDVQIVARGESCDFTGVTPVNVPSNSYTIPSPLTDGTYCWQVQSEGDGGPSGYSAPFTFTVDTLAPTVTVVSAVPSTVGATGSSTITWHANENGSFSVRVGGTSCSNGTQVVSGSYSTSPSDTTSVVNASDLANGPNTVRVCVTDAATNTGSGTITVTKDTTPPPVPTL
jgi:Nidogen-like